MEVVLGPRQLLPSASLDLCTTDEAMACRLSIAAAAAAAAAAGLLLAGPATASFAEPEVEYRPKFRYWYV